MFFERKERNRIQQYRSAKLGAGPAKNSFAGSMRDGARGPALKKRCGAMPLKWLFSGPAWFRNRDRSLDDKFFT
jgi:hypothetical protein